MSCSLRGELRTQLPTKRRRVGNEPSTHLSLIKCAKGAITFSEDNGRRKWTSAAVRSLKKDALAAISNLNTLLKVKPKRKLLSEFVADFLPSVEANYSKTTTAMYGRFLGWLEQMTGNVSLVAITPNTPTQTMRNI